MSIKIPSFSGSILVFGGVYVDLSLQLMKHILRSSKKTSMIHRIRKHAKMQVAL